jgi:hypothetical protein
VPWGPADPILVAEDRSAEGVRDQIGRNHPHSRYRSVLAPPEGGRVCTFTNEAGVILNKPR